MVREHTKTELKDASGAPAATGERSYEDMIVAIARNQDRSAFMGLFEYFAPRVKSYLMKGGMAEATADELAQETMLTVWNKAENFSPAKARASTWIFTIARNKKIDLLRKGIRYDIDIDSPEFSAPDESPSARENIIQEEEAETIADALAALPEEQAELIRQSFFEDKSHSEIAKEKNIPIGTVKSRIRLALDRLRKQQKVRELWP